MVESSDKDQKTEEPTGKRIQEARDKGNLPISRELATFITFVGAFLVVAWTGPVLGRYMLASLSVFIERPEQISLEGGGLQNVFLGVMSAVGLVAAVVFGTFMAAGLLGTMLQTGFYVNPEMIKFDAAKVFSMRGVKRLFSKDSFVDLVKSFFKMVVLGYVAYRVLRPVVENIHTLAGRDLIASMSFLQREAVHLIAVLMVVIAAIAIADWLYTRFQYFKDLRMTKQEVKDEFKQMEGDPVIKSRLRRIRLEKARRRMMAKVPEADVVITNPTHYAVALKYDRTKSEAPVLLAKGIDAIALRIRDLASDSEIPLVSNPPLARTLYDTVDLDETIKPEQYRAVAEVISYVYKIKKKTY